MITREELLHVASLAKIEISEADIQKFSEEINKTAEMAEELHEVDTEGVQPTFHGNHLMDVYREDEAKPKGNTEELLKNAPETEGNFIKVPEMIESEEA